MSIGKNLAALAAVAAIASAVAFPAAAYPALPDEALGDAIAAIVIAARPHQDRCGHLEVCDPPWAHSAAAFDGRMDIDPPAAVDIAIIGPCGCTEFDRCQEGPPWVVAGRIYIEADIHSGHLGTEGGGRAGVEWTF